MNEITAGIADLFNTFFEEVYVVAFFNLMQQQTIDEVANSFSFCGQVISVCNSERIVKIGQYLRKLCSNEQRSSFLTHSVVIFHTKYIYMHVHDRIVSYRIVTVERL